MSSSIALVEKLVSIRNRYGKDETAEKLRLLQSINVKQVKSKKSLQAYYDTLQFIVAYADNKEISKLASDALEQLRLYVTSNQKVKDSLYNTGVTGSIICAAFSFEVTKWLRQTRRDDTQFSYFESDDARIQAILSVVMPKVESEVLQDANAEWKGWLKRTRNQNEELLDQLIAIFDSTSIRPEVKEELWNAIGINIEITLNDSCVLPNHLVQPYFHRSLLSKSQSQRQDDFKPVKVNITNTDAKQIIDCSRLVLIRQLREIDPISFTSPDLVSYYQLSRGISIALVGMTHERRHPIDSYMGYMVFKNGLPIAYAGSRILFDSARIGLNVFPGYRGGESQFIFQQVLRIHQAVYKLNRFSVDPYQIGKENSDGIKSGAFWVYHRAGFRPILKSQRELAETEAHKIKSTPRYRTSTKALHHLADSRMELVMNEKAVRFDANDLSIAWVNLVKQKFNNHRSNASKDGVQKLASILGIKDYREPKMNFVLENWCGLLLANEEKLRSNKTLISNLKKLFELKAYGKEEDYIAEMQRSSALRRFVETLLGEEIAK